ncbi:hypothetical protein GCM10009603_48770 [Nocardiopsis exhalans]
MALVINRYTCPRDEPEAARGPHTHRKVTGPGLFRSGSGVERGSRAEGFRGKGHVSVVLAGVTAGHPRPSRYKELPGRLPDRGVLADQVTCDLRLKRSARHSPDSTTSTSAVAAS